MYHARQGRAERRAREAVLADGRGEDPPRRAGQGALGESHDTAAEVAHFLSQDEGLRVALQGTADDALDGLGVGDLLALGGRRLVQQVSWQVQASQVPACRASCQPAAGPASGGTCVPSGVSTVRAATQRETSARARPCTCTTSSWVSRPDSTRRRGQTTLRIERPPLLLLLLAAVPVQRSPAAARSGGSSGR